MVVTLKLSKTSVFDSFTNAASLFDIELQFYTLNWSSAQGLKIWKIHFPRINQKLNIDLCLTRTHRRAIPKNIISQKLIVVYIYKCQ